ncbi:MAG: histone deacetylase [Desulfosarcinaceae bacterium]|nr:histone deacetylase [Desulfosarcinaceae bacterium]
MLRAEHQTGLVFFPAYDWAISATHPEREERLLYTQDQVLEEGLLDIEGIVELKPDLVTEADVRRVHFCVPEPQAVMTESHFISAGGAKTIAEAVLSGKVARGFALVRPPGHHAQRVVHGARGFCNVNIEAIMVEYLRSQYGIRRVAIVDTDCHHGDGTQDIYWHDPDTLFISLHQDGRTLYPGTGFMGELGGPTALGTTINIPLPPETGSEGFLYALDNTVLPILAEFQPELVINSAGQDNHYSDPITNMNFTAQGYAELTARLKPDIAVLEGGYSIEGALPYVNAGIILAMAGLDYSHLNEPDFDPERLRQTSEVSDWIAQVCDRVMESWQQRVAYGEQVRRRPDCGRRQRNIFYDTDNIREAQSEEIVVCADCAGALRIDSRSDRGDHILAVHLPIRACKACRQQAYDWFEGADATTYHQIFLQDRPEDVYRVRGAK